MRLTSSVSVAQTIIALSSVELTSILVLSHRLRIMALLSSGCRATVEGLTNVQSSSTTQQWQATSLDNNNLHVPCRQCSKHFISGQLKVIPLFCYSVIPHSAFYSVHASVGLAQARPNYSEAAGLHGIFFAWLSVISAGPMEPRSLLYKKPYRMNKYILMVKGSTQRVMNSPVAITIAIGPACVCISDHCKMSRYLGIKN